MINRIFQLAGTFPALYETGHCIRENYATGWLGDPGNLDCLFGLVLSLGYVGAFVTGFLGSSSLFIAVFPSFAVVPLLVALAGKVILSLVYAYAGYFGLSFLLDLFGVQLKKSTLCPEHTWKKRP